VSWERAVARRELGIFTGLAAFVACVWLAVLPVRPLFNPDEGRYAEIPREMLAGGDWVIPHLNGLDYIEKPPLQYWATALSLRMLGPTAFAARLYMALLALAGLGLVGWLAARHWGAAAGWRAGFVLASLSLYPVLGQLLTLDLSLTFYMTLALTGFLLAQRTVSRWPMLLAWAATAAGVLTKGLVAAAIPAAVLLLYTALSRDTGPWRRLQWRLGLPLFLLLSVPWFVLAARRLPDFLQFFFVHEHFARYLTPIADREESWWFFAPVFLAGTLPWTWVALRVLATGWRRQEPPGEFDVRRFLWLWVVFVLLFFSCSDSKLIPYILPAMPALTLLIAAEPASRFRREVLITAGTALLFTLALAVAGLSLKTWLPHSSRSPYFLALAQPVLEVAAVAGVSALFVFARRDRDPTTCTVFLGAGWCLGVLLLLRAASVLAPIYSGASLAAAFPTGQAALPIYSLSTYDQTLPFYLARTVSLAAYHGELDFGLRHDPAAGLPTVAAFRDRWSELGDALAVMEPEMFDAMRAYGTPMRELARDDHHVLVSRR
jgi:4-amino-4-deoxy-L-arabinose transferase-like glycosyltransferase